MDNDLKPVGVLILPTTAINNKLINDPMVGADNQKISGSGVDLGLWNNQVGAKS